MQLQAQTDSNSSISPQNTVYEPLKRARQVICQQFRVMPIVQIDLSQTHDLWTQFKLLRDKMCRKREGEDRREGVTVWMCRCDIDAQMCGGGEVHLQM